MSRHTTSDRFAPRIGDYVVERELPPHNGLIVYEATRTNPARRVMLKVLHPHLVGLGGVALQLMRETCVLEALAHAGAPKAFESGVTPDRRPWLAIELVTGDALDLGRRMSFGGVVALLEGVAD